MEPQLRNGIIQTQLSWDHTRQSEFKYILRSHLDTSLLQSSKLPLIQTMKACKIHQFCGISPQTALREKKKKVCKKLLMLGISVKHGNHWPHTIQI